MLLTTREISIFLMMCLVWGFPFCGDQNSRHRVAADLLRGDQNEPGGAGVVAFIAVATGHDGARIIGRPVFGRDKLRLDVFRRKTRHRV